jgi:hypothetical protein
MTISISGRQPSLSYNDFCLTEKEGKVLLEVITVHSLRFHVKQPRGGGNQFPPIKRASGVLSSVHPTLLGFEA